MNVPTTPRRLEVGSGSRPLPGYEHCDLDPQHPGLDYVCPMWEIPVADGTFVEVKSIHAIHHAPREKWLPTLQEWFRILRPGGLVHIDTANIRRNATMSVQGTWLEDFANLLPAEQELLMVNGKPDATLWLNFKCFSTANQYDVHYGNFDPDLLTAYCQAVGFTDVVVVTQSPSLIVQAVKP